MWFNLEESEDDKRLIAKWKSEQGQNIPILSEKDIPLVKEWLPIPVIINDKPTSKRKSQKENRQERSLLESMIASGKYRKEKAKAKEIKDETSKG